MRALAWMGPGKAAEEAIQKLKSTLPQSELEEKYGLRVNLVAVTGAGGFVDLMPHPQVWKQQV